VLEAIVPMDPTSSLYTDRKLLETFDLLAQKSDHHIEARVLVTLYPGRAPFVKAVVDELHRHLDGRYFETIIRYSIKLAEAAATACRSPSIADMCGIRRLPALVAEVLRREPRIRVSPWTPTPPERARVTVGPGHRPRS